MINYVIICNMYYVLLYTNIVALKIAYVCV